MFSDFSLPDLYTYRPENHQTIKKICPDNSFHCRGKFQYPLPPIRSKDEMQELHSAFSEMQKRLANYMHNLEKTTAVKEKMESELRIAHDIQMNMLPKDFLPFLEHSNVDFYAIIHPARQVGGDFYDFFISGDDLYFAIGDVSGKGIPASLLMSYTISLLRSFSSKPASSSEIARFLNNRITERNEADMFVTFFIGILNLKTGHNTPANFFSGL